MLLWYSIQNTIKLLLLFNCIVFVLKGHHRPFLKDPQIIEKKRDKLLLFEEYFIY